MSFVFGICLVLIVSMYNFLYVAMRVLDVILMVTNYNKLFTPTYSHYC